MLTLKRRIMFRIYALWTLRLLRRPLAAELGALSLLWGALAFTVSIPNIVSNMLASGSAYRYLMFAFSHGNHIAQLLLVLTGITMVYVARNLAPQKVFKLRFVRFA